MANDLRAAGPSATGHPLDNPPLCRTCSRNVIVRYRLAGVPTESRGCERHIRSFPDAKVCRDYEREPGSDDFLIGS